MSRYADVTTDTPHGPRPVPNHHIDANGTRHDRTEKAPSRALVLGGVGIAAAAATALGILAVRTVVNAVSGDDENDSSHGRSDSRRRNAPRFEDLSRAERRAVRARAENRFAAYDRNAADLREAAGQSRRPRPQVQRRSQKGLMDSVGDSASNLVNNITSLIATANAAVDGVQHVSSRADGVVRDLVGAADRVRGFLDTRSTDHAGFGAAEPTRARPDVMTNRRARFVDLREDSDGQDDALRDSSRRV